MRSLRQGSPQRACVDKTQLSPMSYTSFSDCARGWTDDLGGVTRSSGTQESPHLASSSPTRPSFLSASLSEALLISPSFPRGHVKNSAVSDMTTSASAIAADSNEVTPLDVFDVALAQDVQERSRQQHRRRRSTRNDMQNCNTGGGTGTEPAMSLKAADDVTHDAPSFPSKLSTHPPAPGEDSAVAMCPPATMMGMSLPRALLKTQHPSRLPLPTPIPSSICVACGCQNSDNAGGKGSVYTVSSAARDEKLQRLRVLLNEMHSLHKSLCKQLRELYEMEKHQ